MDNRNTLFPYDPFLSLDNDLDDVSEVIRSNMEVNQKILFDSSPSLSPQNANELNDASQFWASVPSKEDEIHQIVSLLREDEPPRHEEDHMDSINLLESPAAAAGEIPMASSSNMHYAYVDSLADNTHHTPYTPPAETSQNGPGSVRGFIEAGGTQNMLYGRPMSLLHPVVSELALSVGYQSDSRLTGLSAPTAGLLTLPVLSEQSLSLNTQQKDFVMSPLPSEPHFATRIKIEDDVEQNFVENEVVVGHRGSSTPAYIMEDHEIYQPQHSQLQSAEGHSSYMEAQQRPPSDPLPADKFGTRRHHRQQEATRKPSIDNLSIAVNFANRMNLRDGQYVILPMESSADEVVSPLAPSSTSNFAISEWAEDSYSEWADDIDDGGQQSDDGRHDQQQQHKQSGNKKPQKTERRTAHNLIEKKYRCSINDRINHLKEMVAADESKLSKSATLRKAIDHINFLRSQNADLLKANQCLRRTLDTAGIPLPTNLTKVEVAAPAPFDAKGNGNKTSVGRPKKLINSQSRITLCTFALLMLVVTGPFAVFFSSEDVQSTSPADHHIAYSTLSEDISPRLFHRSGGDEGPFDTDYSAWQPSNCIRYVFIWLLNALIAIVVLIRLLGEPVFDDRPSRTLFMRIKKNALDSIKADNYKDAQRQLCEALQILGRPLPSPGGFEEAIAFAWQCIRHLLNGIWIGRWFSRQCRSTNQTQKIVCRSHAIKALVYHNLHSLALIGVDGIQLTNIGRFNLALCTVNLAESAGISATGITHKIRHVGKSISLESSNMNSVNWIFHPLARKFVRDPKALRAIFQKYQGPTSTDNFPFSSTEIAPNPIDIISNSFKMHLLRNLMTQLKLSTSTIRVVDYVETYHLLLDICRAENNPAAAVSQPQGKDDGDPISWPSNVASGDELCTWWAHLVVCGLYWSIGDRTKAQMHYMLIRKCPPRLLNKKMCFDDRTKKDFAEMVWIHILKSFTHFEHENVGYPWEVTKNSDIEHLVRVIAHEWMIVSLIELWHFRLQKQQYWESSSAPSQIRRFFHNVLVKLKAMGCENKKILMFSTLGRALSGANPVKTWKMLKSQKPLRYPIDRNQVDGKLCPDSSPFKFSDLIYKMQKDFIGKRNAKVA